MKCPNCNSEIFDDAKFCTSCGTPVRREPSQPTDEVVPGEAGNGEFSSVKQRIYWNIQAGEIACHVNEAEFANYDSAQGLIVNDGTTAYIRSNGRLMAEIHGGTYDFVDPKELEKLLKSRHGGVAGGFSAGWRFLVNALLGRPVHDSIKDFGNDAPEKQESLDAVIESLKRNDTFSLHLKLDKSFPLVFGSGTADTMAEFRPMTVRTRLMDMNVGVRATFRIGDFGAFSEYWLSDKKTVTTGLVAETLLPVIRTAVQNVMQEQDIDSNFLPKSVREAIETEIRAASKGFHGLLLESVDEIVSSNEDLERFRALSREMYLSEQELEYLRRTNDFRNRLAAETNAQTIADAGNDLQLFQGLQAINRDKLLSEDEMDKFYTLLSREKRIRDARSEDEVQAAMDDIAKTGLLRAEEVETLRMDIAERGYKRGAALRLMQLHDELTQRRTVDEYADERRGKEREHYRADRAVEIELDNMEMDAQMERLRKMQEMELEAKRQEQEHQARMERIELEKIERQAQLSAEQLMAIGASQDMNSEGARVFAESFSAGRNAEQAEKAAEARIADARRHEDNMMEIMKQMQQMATTMTGHLVNNSAHQSPVQQQAQPQRVGRFCPSCGRVVEEGPRFCPSCGHDLK